MTESCCSSAAELQKLRARQSGTLKIVLAINAVMFLVEFTSGILASSTSLLADSLDMLGDVFAYGFSLYVVSRNDQWKAVAALFKGAIMAFFGVFVFGQALYKLFFPATPDFEWIGTVGLLALLANAYCLHLLWKHRVEDVNMRSVWLCSRNDIVANTSVLLAAAGVWVFNNQWPDLLVGTGIAFLFLRSAFSVFKDAIAVYVDSGSD